MATMKRAVEMRMLDGHRPARYGSVCLLHKYRRPRGTLRQSSIGRSGTYQKRQLIAGGCRRRGHPNIDLPYSGKQARRRARVQHFRLYCSPGQIVTLVGGYPNGHSRLVGRGPRRSDSASHFRRVGRTKASAKQGDHRAGRCRVGWSVNGAVLVERHGLGGQSGLDGPLMVPSWLSATASADNPGCKRNTPGVAKLTGKLTEPMVAPLFTNRIVVVVWPASSNGTMALICCDCTKIRGAARSPKNTRTPASCRGTVPSGPS